MTLHTIVIGAGIAGLSAAWRLCARGQSRVTLLEREPLPFSHSSARNAAIFRPLEVNAATVRLVARAAQLQATLSPGAPLVRAVGLCLTAASSDLLHPLRVVAEQLGVLNEHLTGPALIARCPALAGGRAREGLWLPEGGVLDIHHTSELLRRELRQAGATQRMATGVRRVQTEGQRVWGVELDSGETLAADQVVIAAGAWAGELGAGCGAPLRLVPHRRHLALLLPTTESRVDPAHPVVWNVETGVYFRPESGGVLACPGDHEPATAGVPLVNDAVLSMLASELPKESPLFDTYAVARPWACLRTVTDTQDTVLGSDPRIHGLFWLAGLGGHGMSAALGAADYLAEVMAGSPLPEWCAPLGVDAHLRPSSQPWQRTRQGTRELG